MGHAVQSAAGHLNRIDFGAGPILGKIAAQWHRAFAAGYAACGDRLYFASVIWQARAYRKVSKRLFWLGLLVPVDGRSVGLRRDGFSVDGARH